MHRNSKQLASRLTIAFVLSMLVTAMGCQKNVWDNGLLSSRIFHRDKINFSQISSATKQINKRTLAAGATVEDRLAVISGEEINRPPAAGINRVQETRYVAAQTNPVGQSNGRQDDTKQNTQANRATLWTQADEDTSAQLSQSNPTVRSGMPIVRAQSPSYDEPPQDGQVVFAGGTQGADTGEVKKVKYQYPELDTPGRILPPGNGLDSPNVGAPNELNPLIQPYERGGNAAFPMNYADLDIYVTETQTGRVNFGGAYNSDNGIVGQFTIDERNFDITRWPKRLRDIADGTAWRGAGQTFRLELVPGNNLERYLVSFSEPYLFGTDYSLSVSGYLFDRQYFDWDESRLGGRVAIGRRLTQDLSFSAGIRMESVTIDNPRVNTSPELNASLGTSNLFLFNTGLIRDTRDSPFQATEGSYMALTYSQAFGDYSYSRGDLDVRRYKLLYERPDGSGRHTLSFGTKLGFSGSDTPVFENYFAGGFSTMRGFDFRGASPVQDGVRVGGEFQWLNTLEYMFPITADDMIKAVLFCDFGTVEESIQLTGDNFRVAPGFGFRVRMPAAGIGAPLAFDFAFPVASAATDEEQVFSFYLGVLR